jgi:hypothetical protein
MKSLQLLIIPIFITASAHADVLSDLSPFLGSSRPNYDPTSLDTDSALLNPKYAPFSPADSDLGVQQILGNYSGRAPVKVSFETSINHTDNAPEPASSLYSRESAWYSASRLAVSWRPLIAHGFFADAGLAQDVFRFDGSRALNFENFAPYIGVIKSLPDLDDLLVYTRYEYQRITTGNLSESDYSTQRIRTGLQKNVIQATNYQLALGVDAAFDINAAPNVLQRNEYASDVTYTYSFTDELSSTLSWRGSIWDFRDGGREDINQIVGLELTWKPTDYARLYTNVFYTNVNSNSAFGANDYRAWQTGLGVGFNFSF